MSQRSPPKKQEAEKNSSRSRFDDKPSSSVCKWRIGTLTLLTLCIFIVLYAIRGKMGSRSDRNPIHSSSHNIQTRIQTNGFAKRLEELKVVSMNLAGCEPSTEAPSSWDASHVAQVVRHELLKSDPDVLALQECPDKQPWAEQLFPEYKVIGVTSSHAGYVMLLVRESLASYSIAIDTGRFLPAVMARITDPKNSSRIVNIASCHLAPFQRGDRERSSQIQTLLELSEGVSLVIMGDTNMREEEDQGMEGAYGLKDAWKEVGAEERTKFTWDTRNHLDEGGYFNRYYGRNTREYATRYDRLYISNQKEGVNVSTQSFELIANRPVHLSNPTHFLSDHFGIACILNLS